MVGMPPISRIVSYVKERDQLWVAVIPRISIYGIEYLEDLGPDLGLIALTTSRASESLDVYKSVHFRMGHLWEASKLGRSRAGV